MPDQTPDRTVTYCLIDGFAEIFRSFYAIRRPLYSPMTGEPTQAVLVFAQSLLKLLTTVKPDYIVVALDPFGKTFRDELYEQYEPATSTPPPAETGSVGEGSIPGDSEPSTSTTVGEPPPIPGYKGTRRETPDSLTQQIPRILELLQLFQIPVIECPGMEADDVIATLTERILHHPEPRKLHVRIVSPDKDLEQLIVDGDRRVTLYNISTGVETNADAVIAKRGVTPAQIVDFLALTGDVVDNIPGVPGIGARTASKLLQRYGSVEGIRNSLPDIEVRWRDRLQDNLRVQIPLSRRLITLERNADIHFDLEDARVKEPLKQGLDSFFETLGFSRLRQQIQQTGHDE
ncbi:MAG: hypothetical protein H7145_11270 [Akkermansiaceae bacterium]|nr:hypothetical protein [Armatimonadota bacterium]